eukprot:scaffold67276_cov49-Phaeocystis_antarctica.AAC.4
MKKYSLHSAARRVLHTVTSTTTPPRAPARAHRYGDISSVPPRPTRCPRPPGASITKSRFRLEPGVGPRACDTLL